MSHHDHIHWGDHDHCADEHVLEVMALHMHYGPVCALHDIAFTIGCGHSLALSAVTAPGKARCSRPLPA